MGKNKADHVLLKKVIFNIVHKKVISITTQNLFYYKEKLFQVSATLNYLLKRQREVF